MLPERIGKLQPIRHRRIAVERLHVLIRRRPHLLAELAVEIARAVGADMIVELPIHHRKVYLRPAPRRQIVMLASAGHRLAQFLDHFLGRFDFNGLKIPRLLSAEQVQFARDIRP